MIKEIDIYMNTIDTSLEKTNLHFIINKFFIFPTGIDNAEVFLYSTIIWN